MRHCRVLLLALTAGALAGCATDKPLSSTSWRQRFQPFQAADSDCDTVRMELALLEVPVGDRSVNGSLWTFIDEQVIALEKKDTLESNGFRIGLAGATPPDELRELIESERTCPGARRIEMHAGKEGKLLELGPPRERCRFDLPQGEQPATVELKKGQCCLLVVPTLTEDGRTRLTFTPQVKHAARDLMPWRPKSDRSGWTRQDQEAIESYAALSWEVTLSPGQYVLVGARNDRPGTLGHTCFVRTDEPTPVQRLLVLRTARPPAIAEFTTADFGSDGNTTRPPPLALHVNGDTARGVAP